MVHQSHQGMPRKSTDGSATIRDGATRSHIAAEIETAVIAQVRALLRQPEILMLVIW